MHTFTCMQLGYCSSQQNGTPQYLLTCMQYGVFYWWAQAKTHLTTMQNICAIQCTLSTIVYTVLTLIQHMF